MTADGAVLIANPCSHADLFWGIKGGGGGSLGVVTRVTLRTHELPAWFGAVFVTIKATSDAAFRRLLGRFIDFYADSLFNPHWGESVAIRPGNTFAVSMVSQGLNRQQAEDVWRPFLDWVAGSPQDFTVVVGPRIGSLPARRWWDGAYSAGACARRGGDRQPAGRARRQFLVGRRSGSGRVLSARLSVGAGCPPRCWSRASRARLADALFAASRHWSVALALQQGPRRRSGRSGDGRAGYRDQSGGADGVRPGNHRRRGTARLPWHPRPRTRLNGRAEGCGRHRQGDGCSSARWCPTRARMCRRAISSSATGSMRSGARIIRDWRRSKEKYDPAGLFFVHHGVGSEAWDADGFTRSIAP